MNVTTNLPEQPTNTDSKFRETLREQVRFLNSLLYIT